MASLSLHDYHAQFSARFTQVNGREAVADYGDPLAEHGFLRRTVAVVDLSFRSRICLTGADRARFLHGQVTNDIRRLQPGQGCYAALTNAKGKIQSDLNVYCLVEELLLDFEPGLTGAVTQRLEKYLVADDVQVVDVGPLYGLLSLQGPAAGVAVAQLELGLAALPTGFDCLPVSDPVLGELYVTHRPRTGTAGFDFYAPEASLAPLAARLFTAARAVGGGPAGWTALETARIEAGIPRYGQDMDEANFPQETSLEGQMVSYQKGCYIGQEVLNRIHTQGHVNRELRGLLLAADLPTLPERLAPLFHQGKEVGYLTSAVASPALGANIGLGYVRREAAVLGTELVVRSAAGETTARVTALPF